jgi:cyclophilin family peptidyl-prolyl cis-trans isomerase
MQTTNNLEVHKRNTIPQIDTYLRDLVNLAELYADSYVAYSKCSTSSALFMNEDDSKFLDKLDKWADTVVFGAALREQSLLDKKCREEEQEAQDTQRAQEEQPEESGQRTLSSL